MADPLEILRRPAGMADAQNYAEVQSYLDIPSFIDYMLLNFYAFPIEYRCLVANLELLKQVDERVKREIAPGLYHE